MYVSNRAGVVKVFSSEGKYVRHFRTTPPRVTSPGAIAFADGGKEVFIVDGATDSVQVFTPSGLYVRGFGKTGSQRGQLWEPSAIAIAHPDDERFARVFVCDNRNGRITVWRRNGIWIRAIAPGFHAPTGSRAIDVSQTELSTWRTTSAVFDFDGKFLRKFGRPGRPDHRGNMHSLAVDAVRGLVYVSEYWTSRVQIWSLRGEFLCEFGSVGCILRMCVDSAGRLLVCDSEHRAGGAVQVWGY